MTARVLFVASTLLALTLAPGCKKEPTTASGTAGQPGAAPAASTEGDIVVGQYASLTGTEATFGVSTDDGVKLAVKEQNAKGGIKGRHIKLITYDNQGKPQETVTVVTRLIDQDNAAAILGEVASSRSIAGGQVCQRKGIPMVSPSSTNAKVTQIGDMIFRACFIDGFQGYVGAKFATDNLKAKTAAILYNRAQAYSAGLSEDFKKAFTDMGGKIAIEQAYADGDNDFSAQLTAIRGASPDVIYIPGYYTEVVTIAKQAKQLGMNIPLLGGDGWDSEELKNAGDALDNAYYSNHYSHEEQRPEVVEFNKRFKDEYGKTPDGLGALGYDAAELLFDAMGRAKSLSGPDLAAALAATKDLQLVSGKITIDANRNPKKSAVVLKLHSGIPGYVATIQPPQ